MSLKVGICAGLAVLLIICLTLAWTTRDAMAELAFLRGQTQSGKGSAAASSTLVNLRPWQTAQELAPMAVSAEETEYTREAQRLAGHEVDQAFAWALGQAQSAAQHRALAGQALALSQKVTQLQQNVSADEANVQDLSTKPASAADVLAIAKAQLDLDSDELSDAQQDLARALGDDRPRIQQELAAHEASMKKAAAAGTGQGQSAVATSKNYGTLAKRLTAWFAQRSRQKLIEAAGQQAGADVKALIAQHDAAEKKLAAPDDAGSDTMTRLRNIKRRSMHSQMLSILDDRIQTQQQLAAVYGKWSAQVLLQHRIVFHLLMQSSALVLFIALCGMGADALLRQLLKRAAMDRRRKSTLRLAGKLSIEAMSALLILLVIFGPPNEMPAILGLTTAGLTVVLQDFIVSFCGWFVLMGKNGIRVGDWVEINSVGGEVVDVGLLRTTMLETGNWTDRGHPTGRRVTMMNSFAVKGQYFNFSTTGQWMWDELTVNVPPSEDAYSTIALIQKAVAEETEKEARIAEEEWTRLARQNGMSHFSAVPAVNLRPGPLGIEVLVRYVTRAATRYDLRNRLYVRVIGLLHKAVGAATG